MRHRTHEQEMLQLEMEIDEHRWQAAHELAEDIIRDMGWSEVDDDFCIQVNQEAKRIWEREYERDACRKRI